MAIVQILRGHTRPSRSNSLENTMPPAMCNSPKGGGGILHISVSMKNALPTKQCSMASNYWISEEFRRGHKSAYKTTISHSSKSQGNEKKDKVLMSCEDI